MGVRAGVLSLLIGAALACSSEAVPTSPDEFANGRGGSPTAELVVRLLDVNGDAIYITNGASRVIIDGGSNPSRFASLLDELGVRDVDVDLVILSHGHEDHFSGLRELFKTDRGLRLGTFFDNLDPITHPAGIELRDSVQARVARGALIYRSTEDPCGHGSPICTYRLDGGALLHVLPPRPSGSINNRSVALKLVGPDSAAFTMWLAGDAEHRANEWFHVEAGYHLQPGMAVRVLKAQHHGHCDAIGPRYLDLVRPEWVVIPSRGPIALPTQTRELLESRQLPWYRTDLNGTITIRSAGKSRAGYSISVAQGTASMVGANDAPATAAACAPEAMW